MRKIIILITLMINPLKAQISHNIYSFPKMDGFNVRVNASAIEINEDQYEYSYSLSNATDSEQDIAIFMVYHNSNIISIINPSGWINTTDRNSGKIVWGAESVEHDIAPGEKLNGFRIISSGLPSIQRYYCQAYVELPVLDIEPDSTIGGTIQSNSMSDQTITARSISIPFRPVAFLDSLIMDIRESKKMGWIVDAESFNQYENYSAQIKISIEQNNFIDAKLMIGELLKKIQNDSGSVLTSESYALIKLNFNYLLSQLPEPINQYLIVKLTDSQNTALTGGILLYYENDWKTAEDHGDGTFTVTTELAKVKLRMTYEHGIQEKSNVPVKGNTCLFRTVSSNVRIKNSQQALIDSGIVQYYSGGWFILGATTGGIARKELLPGNYKFRMTYGHASNEKYQDIGIDSTVVFQTVPVSVSLKDNQSAVVDTGTVQYYAGGWWDFGTTSNGVVLKELLPYNYKFRMTYAKASNEKYQDVESNPVVLFQTLPVNVKLTNSQSAVIDTGKVQYYSGGWWDFGTTSDGVVSKELLPYNYKFRMTYAKASNEKYQDVGVNPEVIFRTVNARVSLKDSQNNLMDTGEVKYYSGGWWDLGTTAGGSVSKELLPFNYKFRMTYAKASSEKYQDVGIDPDVLFQTVNTRVELRNSQGTLMDAGLVKYYSGGWWDFGVTSGGSISRELLPYNYKFRMTYANGSNEKYQDTGVNPVIVFPAVSAVVRVSNLQGDPVNNADVKYYSGGWFPFGVTSRGTVTRELLPYNYKFRATAGSKTSEKYQDMNVNPVVIFTLDVP